MNKNNTKPKTKFNNLLDVVKLFPTEKHCREYLEKLRWNGNIVCQKCGSDEKIYKINDGKLYKCSKCRKQFTVRVGTIFEDSPLPLQKWFMCIYLCTAHKKGISSWQLSRDLDVTQTTAWHMLHRVRYAIKTKSFNMPLNGIVEADETYWGAPEKNKHKSKRTKHSQGRNTETKTPIFGLVQRDGSLLVTPVPDVKGETLKGIIGDVVSKGSTIVTDEWGSYNGLHVDYTHLRVEHGRGEYVNGIAHTNTMEGFWSLLKRGIHGIYHQVSDKHLSRYCDEFSYRYNSRKITDIERFEFTLKNLAGRLTYSDLTQNKL